MYPQGLCQHLSRPPHPGELSCAVSYVRAISGLTSPGVPWELQKNLILGEMVGHTPESLAEEREERGTWGWTVYAPVVLSLHVHLGSHEVWLGGLGIKRFCSSSGIIPHHCDLE